MITQIPEPHCAIGFGVGMGQIGQHLAQRRIRVVKILEVQKLGDERAPLALGDAHREQDQEGIEPGLFDLDPAGRQEFDHHAGGNAHLLHRAVGQEARRHDGDLDRIDQRMIRSQPLEPMPRISRNERPARAVGGGLVQNPLWLPDVEPPAVLHLLTDRLHRPAETQRLVDGLLHETAPGRLLHHRGCHIERGDDAVLR